MNYKEDHKYSHRKGLCIKSCTNLSVYWLNISLINSYLDQINGIIREIENKKKNVNKLIKKHELQGNLNKFEFLVFINIVALQDLAYSKKEILEALLLFSNK